MGSSLGFIRVSVPIDVNADNTYVMNMEGINVEQAYDGEHKPVPVTELSSGAQDAPLAILDANEASEVVARLLVHVNTKSRSEFRRSDAKSPRRSI